jgi:hypothetical protein
MSDQGGSLEENLEELLNRAIEEGELDFDGEIVDHAPGLENVVVNMSGATRLNKKTVLQVLRTEKRMRRLICSSLERKGVKVFYKNLNPMNLVEIDFDLPDCERGVTDQDLAKFSRQVSLKKGDVDI